MINPWPYDLPQNPLAKKYDMTHVKYCLLGEQTFPLELVDDLVKVFPNCTLGQAYGMSSDIPRPYRAPGSQSDLIRAFGNVDGCGDNAGVTERDAEDHKRREIPAGDRL